MGIKELNKLLKSKCPDVFKPMHLSYFAYKKVAIDITLFLCKFKSKSGSDWLASFVSLITCLRSYDIHCVFIYDNGHPVEKTDERQTRVENREKTRKRTEDLENALYLYKTTEVIQDNLASFYTRLMKDNSTLRSTTLNVELAELKIAKMKNYDFKITPDDFALTRELFDILKIPYYLSPLEAETMCSDLCKRKLVDGVLSEDTDVLAYGAPIFLTKLDFYNGTCVKIEYNDILERLKLTTDEFLDICIMLGCDYNSRIPKIGPEAIYKLIKQHRNIDEIARNNPKIDVSNLKHIRVREMFKDYTRAEIKDNYIPYCGTPDMELLKEFLIRNNIDVDLNKFQKAITLKNIIFKEVESDDVESNEEDNKSMDMDTNTNIDMDVDTDADTTVDDENNISDNVDKENMDSDNEITEICFFDEDKPYYEFSNFFKCTIHIDGEYWITNEHYFQAAKFDNLEYKKLIRDCNTPYKAMILGNQQKKFGYASNWTINTNNKNKINDIIDKYKNTVTIRPDWEEIKDNVMETIVEAKFTQNESLKQLLLSTKKAILKEESPFDNYWGIGKNKTGLNRLGEILMKIRTKLM